MELVVEGQEVSEVRHCMEGTPMESLAVEEKSEWNEVACYLAGSWGS